MATGQARPPPPAGIELQDRTNVALDRARRSDAAPVCPSRIAKRSLLGSRRDGSGREKKMTLCSCSTLVESHRSFRRTDRPDSLTFFDLRAKAVPPALTISAAGDDVINGGRLGQNHRSPPRSLLKAAPPGTGRRGTGAEMKPWTKASAIYSAATVWGDRQTGGRIEFSGEILRDRSVDAFPRVRRGPARNRIAG